MQKVGNSSGVKEEISTMMYITNIDCLSAMLGHC